MFAVLNPSDSEQQMKLSINGAKVSAQGDLWRMSPSSVDATISVGKEPGVEVKEPGTIGDGLPEAPDEQLVPFRAVEAYTVDRSFALSGVDDLSDAQCRMASGNL